MLNSRPALASKSLFQHLDVESGEEEEEEVVDEPTQPESESDPSKPTKSAIKRAQKAARIQKKLEQKAASRARREQEAVASEPEKAPVEQQKPQELPIPTESQLGAPPEPEELDPPLPELPVAQNPEVSPPIHVSEQIHSRPEPALPVEQNLTPPVPKAEPQAPSLEQVVSMPSVIEVKSAPPDVEAVKKRQGFITRTLWTFIMIGGFLSLLLLGHAYMIVLVLICQTVAYREVTALFSLPSAQAAGHKSKSAKAKDPWRKTLNWYFFAVTNYFLYGESIIYYFKHVVFADAQLTPFATNHRFISFSLYTIGFMGFVMSLKKGYLKQQFGMFCWVHMSLMMLVVSSHFIVNNILEGLIWFWVPASLVICNDVFAYIWGITIGHTPLIALSPKKTVEGFVGAFFSTMVFGVIWGTYFMRFDYMICPVHNLGVSAWSSVSCVPNPVFVWKEWEIWRPVAAILSNALGWQLTTIPYAPYQFHLLVMSCFASLVAPFGGFFASGFKRAFDVKDFGDSIPGHGGMTDRMDCQFLMGIFTYVYYSSLVRVHHVTVGSVLQTIASGLTVQEQIELLRDLRRYLESQGIPTNL
ncbi:hypothetical protein PC9H_007884 [Pleurotus ostreatus]|uniref:Phosphatidate cytidylyltransferase n=1 Tax=Pleurotus ostreatus TaxID=5322 RepID=A0A8H6ZS51_PLEOS|nr:uncharacterized protein PC9H_007884 [Pleurotus ostreatus]KAF7428655.1 hypothetical protein PC9H_007884 [Pleurotus ostreatus]KAJ8696838.1 phosphatidate cytidylyltransferase [Pleurotus ostreatus]